MPTIVHSAARPTRGSSVELHKLLLCLGVVVAFVFTSFGLAKLFSLFSWRRARRLEVTGRKTPSETPAPTRSFQVHSVHGRLFPVFTVINPPDVFFRKALRPQDLRTGAIQYTKTSPHLYHISAPRSYAMRHCRQGPRTRPGPSPLRNVINANPPRKTFTNRGLHKSGKSLNQRYPEEASFQRTWSMSAPLSRAMTDAAVFKKSIRARVAATQWPSVDDLHRIADAVVGAHPDALPLHDRPAPVRHQTSFPWVASSGANFKFGLVRGKSAASASGPPPEIRTAFRGWGAVGGTPKIALKPADPGIKSRATNIPAKKILSSGFKAQGIVPKIRGGLKENATPV